ncbi:MAG TPA: aminoacyl-tRNA hydrolase [Devosia sp.]|nr:aminoacyl-tRNA hydrolase [Devosia sp.]
MHLIVGLGNPGAKYARHRHNIGAMAVEAIAAHHNFPPFKNKFNSKLSDGKIDGHRVLLLKPETFMNRSGDAVQAASKFYKTPPENIIVIYDEIDLAPGKVRVKTGGGNGGHNGLRSIDPQIGTGYMRVRLGIGHPGHKELVNRHVLSDFHKVDFEWLDPLLAAIAENAALLVTGNAANFMNKMALATKRPGNADKSAQPKPAPRTLPARPTSESVEGPLAGMLKKLFGQNNKQGK